MKTILNSYTFLFYVYVYVFVAFSNIQYKTLDQPRRIRSHTHARCGNITSTLSMPSVVSRGMFPSNLERIRHKTSECTHV
jgi:hypothetical protein